MPIFIKENEQLKNDMFKVPQNVLDHLNTTLSTYGDYSKSDGYKRLNTLVNKEYNKRSDKEENIEDDGKHISFSDLKRIHHDFKTIPNKENDLSFVLNGGNVMKDWVSSSLRQARNAVKPTLKTQKQQTLQKNILMPTNDPTKPIKADDKSTVYMHENCKLNESDDYHMYYDKISEYNEAYIFNCFVNKKSPWSTMINPNMYSKALTEFTKYGRLIQFPTKYIYQWMGIIMRGTAILRAMTDIAGHSQWFPTDEVVDFFFDGDDDKWQEYKDSISEDNDYSAAWEYFEEIGYDEWQQLPDGSDAISDFGIKPLENIIMEYNSNSTPEETLVIVNKALDVVHCRGDLSSMFIEGGAKSLQNISYRQNESRQLSEGYITKYVDFDNKTYNPKIVTNKILPKNQLSSWFKKMLGINFTTNDVSKLLNYYDIKPLQKRYFLTNDKKQIMAYDINTLLNKTLERTSDGKLQLSQKSNEILKPINKTIVDKGNNKEYSEDERHERFLDSIRDINPEDFKEPTSWEKMVNNESVKNKKVIIKENQLLSLFKKLK